MGPLWSQGLERISVNYGVLGKIGIEGRELEEQNIIWKIYGRIWIRFF